MKDKTKKQEVKVEDPQTGVLKNQLARALADYDNLRKRTEEEKTTWIKFATQKFIANLLPIFDIFEASLTHTKDQGLAIGINQLKDLLRQEGIEEINPKVGDHFDENLHEVIETVPGKVEDEGKISEVIMRGWKFVGGNVIRHARVKVYIKKEEAE